MKKKLLMSVGILAVLIGMGLFGLVGYVQNTCDIEYAIVHSTTESTRWYCPQWLARFWLFNFRGNQKDIETLEAGNGLAFIFNNPDMPREMQIKYANFFLAKGIDINSVGFLGYTALHEAVIQNEPENVKYLLDNGADPSIKIGQRRYGESGDPEKAKRESTKLTGMDAVELSKFLSGHAKNDKDRSAVIKLLNDHAEK